MLTRKIVRFGILAAGLTLATQAQAYDLNNGRLLASNCTQCHATNVLPKTGGYDSLVGKSYSDIYGELREFQQKEEAPAQDAEAELPETEDADTTEEAAPAADAAETEDAAPEKAGEDFWEKDESQLKLDPPPADPNAVFQGVSFSE